MGRKHEPPATVKIALMVIGRGAFLVAMDVAVVAAGGGAHSFLGKPVGAAYFLLWNVWWIVTFIGRQTGRKSPYDRSRFLIVALSSLLVPALVVWPPWEHTHFAGGLPKSGPLPWAGLALFAAGIGLQAWAMWTLRGFFTRWLNVQPDQQLVTWGPYRLVRHPGYASYIVCLLGLSLAMGSAGGLIITAASVAFIVARIGVEEEMLRDAFGEEYRRYAAKRARIFPGVY